MTTYFISRHSGAVQWAQKQDIIVDKQLSHLEIENIQENDVVIGSLPVNLVAGLCLKKARYLHLVLDIPQEFRGMELDTQAMQRFGARLEEYFVKRVK